MLIFFMSRHYYFVEKLKIMEKNLHKLNCSYGKVSHTLKITFLLIYSVIKTSLGLFLPIKADLSNKYNYLYLQIGTRFQNLFIKSFCINSHSGGHGIRYPIPH